MTNFEKTLNSLLDNGSHSVNFCYDGVKYNALIRRGEFYVSTGKGDTPGEALDRALTAVLMEFHISYEEEEEEEELTLPGF